MWYNWSMNKIKPILIIGAAVITVAGSAQESDILVHCQQLANGAPVNITVADPLRLGTVNAQTVDASRLAIERCLAYLAEQTKLRNQLGVVPVVEADSGFDPFEEVSAESQELTDMRDDIASLQFQLRELRELRDNPPAPVEDSAPVAPAQKDSAPSADIQMVGRILHGNKEMIIFRLDEELKRAYVGETVNGNTLIKKDTKIFWGELEL